MGLSPPIALPVPGLPMATRGVGEMDEAVPPPPHTRTRYGTVAVERVASDLDLPMVEAGPPFDAPAVQAPGTSRPQALRQRPRAAMAVPP